MADSDRDPQPLSDAVAISKPDGTPTQYFIRWAQARQFAISGSITAAQCVEIIDQFLADHPLVAGSGISLAPSGNVADGVTIAAEVQAILDQISTTQGAVLFRGAADWQALAPGTAGFLFSTNGPAADPAWIAPPSGGGGAMALISEVVTSATQASVTFSSIPNTYRDLEIRIRGRSTNAANNDLIRIQFNGDTGANYDVEDAHWFASGTVFGQALSTTSLFAGYLAGAGSTASYVGGSLARIFDYRGTTFFKQFDSDFGSSILNSAIGGGKGSGIWRNTVAINAVKVFPLASNFVNNSVVSLYGIM